MTSEASPKLNIKNMRFPKLDKSMSHDSGAMSHVSTVKTSDKYQINHTIKKFEKMNARSSAFRSPIITQERSIVSKAKQEVFFNHHSSNQKSMGNVNPKMKLISNLYN